MEAKTSVWLAVLLIAVMNLYVGRLLAVWGLPRAVVGTRSLRVGAFFFLVGSVGLLLLVSSNGFRLTVEQASILSGVTFGSYLVHRSFYGTGEPPVPWDEYLNRKIHAVIDICSKHGWDIGSPDSIMGLAEAGKLRFGGADYDALVRLRSKIEDEFKAKIDPMNADGTINYDLACAREIVTLSNSLTGVEGEEGLVSKVSHDYDMSAFDYSEMECLQWIAAGLVRQWGLDILFGVFPPNEENAQAK